jgi:hypothetical protein
LICRTATAHIIDVRPPGESGSNPLRGPNHMRVFKIACAGADVLMGWCRTSW